jgi:protein-S-isoprenylcysteine O-methyltransferase Ste14
LTSQVAADRSPHRTASLVVRSLLAGAWFAFCFFLLFPAGVLWATGASLAPPPGATRWLGAAALVACHVALIRQVRSFIVDGGGTHAPFDPPRAMIRHGDYARTRNPMYLTYVGIALGEALLFRSPALVAYALAFWGLAHLYLVTREEKLLHRRFGPEWDAYASRVPRWLPRLR